MADLSKYQVYTDAMELANAVMKSHGHYTREFKYTLGNETVTKALALIDCVVRGLNGYDKKRKQRNYLKSDYYKFLAKKRKKQLFNHQTT